MEDVNDGGTVYGGMIIGEGLNTSIVGVKAAGYLQISALQGYVGGIAGYSDSLEGSVGKIKDTVTFVEITVDFAENVNAVNGAGNAVLENNVFLENNIFAAGAVISGTSEQGTAAEEAIFLSESSEGEESEVGNMVKGDVMRLYLLPGETYDGDYIEITNYRQLCLIKAYGWANFRINGKIYLPVSIKPAENKEYYSGEILYINSGGIYGDVLSDTVYIVGTGQAVIIRKYE